MSAELSTFPYPQLLTAALTALVALITYWMRPRDRVVWGVVSQSVTFAPEPSVPIRLFSFAVINTGRVSAKSIEIFIAYTPEHIQLFPPIFYAIDKNTDGGCIVRIPNIAPRDWVNITLYGFKMDQQIPAIGAIRWKNGVSRIVPISPQRIYPKTMAIGFMLLSFLGIATLIYSVIRFSIFLLTIST